MFCKLSKLNTTALQQAALYYMVYAHIALLIPVHPMSKQQLGLFIEVSPDKPSHPLPMLIWCSNKQFEQYTNYMQLLFLIIGYM